MVIIDRFQKLSTSKFFHNLHKPQRRSKPAVAAWRRQEKPKTRRTTTKSGERNVANKYIIQHIQNGRLLFQIARRNIIKYWHSHSANTISKEKSRVKSSGNTVRHERWNIQNVANDEENQHRRNPDSIPNHNGCLNILESAMGCDGFVFCSRETAVASQRSGQRVYGESRSAAPETVAACSCDACHAKQLRPRSLRRFNLPGQMRRATKIHQCHTCHVNNHATTTPSQQQPDAPSQRPDSLRRAWLAKKLRRPSLRSHQVPRLPGENPKSRESIQRVTKCRCLKEKRRRSGGFQQKNRTPHSDVGPKTTQSH